MNQNTVLPSNLNGMPKMPHFWHSKKQAEHFAKNNQMPCNKDMFKVHHALIGGVKVPYTTMTFSDKSQFYYADTLYIGEGEYSHSEGAW